MKDFSSREDRVRTPVKGLRQRLRVAVRAAGVMEKFRTDHTRKNLLLIMSKEAISLPFTTFEGHEVRVVRVKGMP